jgi:hypothetical protein
MWPFKKKYDKLTREEVVESICSLEKELSDIENDIMSSQGRVDQLMAKGKAEKSNELRVFYAKKINAIKDERSRNIQRATYLMYNIQLLEKLKRAIDDNQFFSKNSKTPLNQLLADQKGLAVFLNKALNTRIDAEQVLTEADETFKTIEDSYVVNEDIYGEKQADSALLSIFETDDMLDDTSLTKTEVAAESLDSLAEQN